MPENHDKDRTLLFLVLMFSSKSTLSQTLFVHRVEGNRAIVSVTIID